MGIELTRCAFTVIVEQETDGRWLAEVPEMPGLLSYGTTPEEARSKVEILTLRVLAERIEHGEQVSQLASIFDATIPMAQDAIDGTNGVPEDSALGASLAPRIGQWPIDDKQVVVLLEQLVEALRVFAQWRLADRQTAARRSVKAVHHFFLMLHEHSAAEPIGDLFYAFLDLQRGRRAELFEPVKNGPGRRTSVRENRLRAWAIAAAEALEVQGQSSLQANRKVGEIVENYGMPIGRKDSKTNGTVIAGWRRNLRRQDRTNNEILEVLPNARAIFKKCHNEHQILGLLAGFGIEDVQFAPVLDKKAEPLGPHR